MRDYYISCFPIPALGKSDQLNVAKFADTGIYALMELLKEEGVRPMSLKAKIAGGSQMFQFGSSDTIRIGPRNVEAVKKELQRLSIPLIAEDTGVRVAGQLSLIRRHHSSTFGP